jgi:hypothetical protein
MSTRADLGLGLGPEPTLAEVDAAIDASKMSNPAKRVLRAMRDTILRGLINGVSSNRVGWREPITKDWDTIEKLTEALNHPFYGEIVDHEKDRAIASNHAARGLAELAEMGLVEQVTVERRWYGKVNAWLLIGQAQVTLAQVRERINVEIERIEGWAAESAEYSRTLLEGYRNMPSLTPIFNPSEDDLAMQASNARGWVRAVNEMMEVRERNDRYAKNLDALRERRSMIAEG